MRLLQSSTEHRPEWFELLRKFACREMKVSSHPGRPCWVGLVLCQLAGIEAVSLQRVDPEPPSVACIICQGAYVPDAAGSVSFTFHLDCGNGYVSAVCGRSLPTSHSLERFHV